MYFWTLALLGVSALRAADAGRLALALRAQTDFDRVELAAAPPLGDSVQCVQSQAALLPVALAEEASLAHYRKGYCTLAGALVTRNAAEFADAGREFEKSLESWACAPAYGAKDRPPEPVSSGLRVLASISRLKAGLDRAGVDRERVALAQALGDSACPAGVMPVGLCQAVLGAGRRWLGWIALDRDNLPEAARDFSGAGAGAAGAEGWSAWVAGRLVAQSGRSAEAAAAYKEAIDAWTASRPEPASLVGRLIPEPDLAPAYFDLGSAQIQAGDAPAAIASFDEVVKRSPSNAHAIYLRGRAKELAGRSEPALADYSLASRTAFAQAQDLASGEAHLYRGVLLYRRKDFERAEGGVRQRAELRHSRAVASRRRGLATPGGGGGRRLRIARVSGAVPGCGVGGFPERRGARRHGLLLRFDFGGGGGERSGAIARNEGRRGGEPRSRRRGTELGTDAQPSLGTPGAKPPARRRGTKPGTAARSRAWRSPPGTQSRRGTQTRHGDAQPSPVRRHRTKPGATSAGTGPPLRCGTEPGTVTRNRVWHARRETSGAAARNQTRHGSTEPSLALPARNSVPARNPNPAR